MPALVLILLCSFLSAAQAGLKIYYIRHGETGGNVAKDWKDKPKEQWPAYVGNSRAFSPEGEKQVVAATEKLKNYRFDFIASSPAWRTRNTVLPYLKATGQKAEIWPELVEGSGDGLKMVGDPGLPAPGPELFRGGSKIEIPEEESASFVIREDAAVECETRKEERAHAADMKALSERTVEIIKKRFGGSDKSILLVGHNGSGKILLETLLQDYTLDKGLKNTGIWMVEEQADGSFQARLLNDTPWSNAGYSKEKAPQSGH